MTDDQIENGKPRSFTVRVPLSLYIKLSEMAQAESLNLNQKVNQVIRLGLGEHISLDAMLGRMIKTKLEESTTNE